MITCNPITLFVFCFDYMLLVVTPHFFILVGHMAILNKPEAMVFRDTQMTTMLVCKWDAPELRDPLQAYPAFNDSSSSGQDFTAICVVGIVFIVNYN